VSRQRSFLGRRAATAAIVIAAVLAAVPRGREDARAADGTRAVWAIEAPDPGTLAALAQDAGAEVRWVERGLVVFETDPASLPPAAWGARAIAARPADCDLAVARGDEIASVTARHAHAMTATARLRADAGPVWIGIAPPGRLPADACHHGVFRAPRHADPRSILETGPPAALATAAAAARLPLPAALQGVAATVSPDSLAAWLTLVTQTSGGDPADRYVYNEDLETIYAPRVEAAMQRLVQGIAGATVSRQKVTLTADSTYNLVARLPGSVPGTGTFVVSAHLDATGTNDPAWVSDVSANRAVFTPGAEDNATGIAAVLELLRCLGDGVRTGTLDIAVDLEFVAFSAEEIGLVGSDQFVRRPRPAPLLGCLNFDMVGYDDSLPGNLQIVHNPQSTWLAQIVHDAVSSLAPPRVTSRMQLDEARASDHNSFWTVGAAGILLADAPVSTLRRYDTYHRPIDLLARVDVGKLTLVTTAVLAALERFDTGFASEPVVAFAPQDLQLRFQVQGQLFRYVPGFHRLVPGAPLFAQATVHSLGAPFDGTLRFELYGSRGGARLTVLDSTLSVTLPTVGQFVLRHPVPILAGDGGWHRLDARVSSQAQGGATVVSTALDSFLVDATPPPALALAIRPNPVRDVTSATLEFAARGFPGSADVEIYDLEGQRVATLARVAPRLIAGGYSVRLAPAAGGGGFDLRSGAYIVRLVWRDAGGATATATAPLVVVR
jgi:hypothetical protein